MKKHKQHNGHAKWNDWCFRPRICTKAILGRGQPGLIRWIMLWIIPLVQYLLVDLLTSSPACYHCTTISPLIAIPKHSISSYVLLTWWGNYYWLMYVWLATFEIAYMFGVSSLNISNISQPVWCLIYYKVIVYFFFYRFTQPWVAFRVYWSIASLNVKPLKLVQHHHLRYLNHQAVAKVSVRPTTHKVSCPYSGHTVCFHVN